MPLLDFDNPLDKITSSKTSITAPKDCYLYYFAVDNNAQGGTIVVLYLNNKPLNEYKVYTTSMHDCIKVSQGDVVSITGIRSDTDGIVEFLEEKTTT